MRLIKADNKGLTLIELMIAMAVMSIIMAAMFGVHNARQRSHRNQKLLVEMQQNSRAAVSLMKREIRLAGYDPTDSDNFGILVAENDTIQFTMDLNNNGSVDAMNENISYGIFNGNLMRNAGGGLPQDGDVVAYDIEALRFAYAFDSNADGQLETSATYDVDGDSLAETPAPGAVIWAIDSDGDGDLDRILDTNYDGSIDENDTAGGFAMPAASQANIADIRSVRIYLLARTSAPVLGYKDNRSYILGDLIHTPEVQYKMHQRQLLTSTAGCKNMGY